MLGYRQRLQSSCYKYVQRIRRNYFQIMKEKFDDNDLTYREYKYRIRRYKKTPNINSGVEKCNTIVLPLSMGVMVREPQ